ncbi:hypothetical protein [Tellurirhabdus bombi]|nr:hypothetical protein [Tellurirhabdus bombi]
MKINYDNAAYVLIAYALGYLVYYVKIRPWLNRSRKRTPDDF